MAESTMNTKDKTDQSKDQLKTFSDSKFGNMPASGKTNAGQLEAMKRRMAKSC